MRASLLLAIVSANLYGQSVIENWPCPTVSSATNANPVVLTMCGAHGFAGNVGSKAYFTAVPSDGDTATVDGVTYTFKLIIDNMVANQVRIPDPSEFGGVALSRRYAMADGFAAAINNTATDAFRYNGTIWTRTTMAGVNYSSATTAHPTVRAGDEFNTRVWVQYTTPGFQSPAIAVSKTGTAFNWYELDLINTTTTLKLQWWTFIEGATGGWSGLNRLVVNALPWVATYQSSTSFSVRFNSSSAGTFSGQSLSVRRSDGKGYRWMYVDLDNSWANTEAAQEGQLAITIPACLSSSDDYECARGFGRPENQKAYGDSQNVTSFTVSGGVATIVMASTWTQNIATDPMAVDAPVWLRGYQRYYIDKAITGVADNGGLYRITANAHGCVAGNKAAVTGTGTTADGEGWVISGITTNTVDLVGSTYAAGWASGGRLACNPNGWPSQAEAANMMKGSGLPYKIFRVQTYNAGTKTITLNVSLRDGTYTGTCAAAACQLATTQPYVQITQRAYPYIYVHPRNVGTNASIWPSDMLFWQLKSGTYNPNSNRYRVWFKWARNIQMGPNYMANNGTYVVQPNADMGGASHFYHYTAENYYANTWAMYEFNGNPSHEVGGAGGIQWPNGPIGAPGHPYAPSYAGQGPRPYMQAQALNYFDMFGGENTADRLYHSGQTVYVGRLEFDYDSYEPPDEWIHSIVAQYSDNRFISGTLTANAGYEITWSSIPFDSVTSFAIKYSTSDMHSTGFAAGTSGGTYTAPQQAFGNGNVWQSPTMAQESTLYVAIRPTAQILSASAAGENIWLITRGDLNMPIGDHVTVAGAGGNRDATNAAITGVSPRKIWFRFKPSTSTTWTVADKLTSIIALSNTCTATITEAHGLVPGWKIEVTGSTNATLGGSAVAYPSAKIFTVATVPTAETFTFTCTGVPNGTYNADLSGYHLNIHAFPGIQLAGTATGSYSGAGTIVSTEDTKHFTQVAIPTYGVSSPPVITTSSPLPPGAEHNAYAQTFTAAGDSPITWSSSDLPAWLSLTSGGLLSGTPTMSGTYNFHVTATNGSGAGTDPMQIVVSSVDNPISVLPGQLSFAAISGGSDPATQTLTASCPFGCGTITPISDQVWCLVSQVDDVTTVAPAITGYAAGSYACLITVAGSDATNNPSVAVPVSLLLTVAPGTNTGVSKTGKATASGKTRK